MKAIKVLYIFDKYLNRTMNWAHRMITHTPDIQPIIASPLIVRNEFFEKDWDFILSPFQYQTLTEEFDVSRIQKLVNYLVIRQSNLYKKSLIKAVKKLAPDIIHIHFGGVGVDFMEIAFTLNIPLVVTFHGYDYEMLPRKKPLYRVKYAELFERVAAITVGGTDCYRTIIEMGCSPQKSHIVTQGIEPKSIIFKPKYKKTNHLSLFQACAFSEKKGVIDTVQAFLLAVKKCPNMTLKIAGEMVDVKIEKEIFLLKKENTNGNKITIIATNPVLPYSKLIEELQQCHVFIHPSVTATDGNRETAPVVMMDAQATGTPVISTLHSDIPELVIHEKGGLLATEHDVDTLAKHIVRFYEMGNEEYQWFAKKGRQHIENEYDVKSCGINIREVYSNISENIN